MDMSVEARVLRGAELLDEQYPGWIDKINLGTLNLRSGDNCVLGQVYKPDGISEGQWHFSSARGYNALGFRDKTDDKTWRWDNYGFYLTVKEDEDYNHHSVNWSRLTNAWKKYILNRRAEPTP
jgi:hypothetical protein